MLDIVMPSRKKVLVIDDDPGVLEVISMILDDAGYAVQTARSGDLVYRIKREVPDLFLLDIWMAGRDGCRICRYIKSRKELTGVPVVLVSANRNGAEMARDAGANDFIAKPFDMDDLLDKVALYTYNTPT